MKMAKKFKYNFKKMGYLLVGAICQAKVLFISVYIISLNIFLFSF